MKKNLPVMFTLLIALNFTSHSQSLNARMTQAIKAAIGSDIKEYTPFSYPTDNYGLITSYEKKVKQKNFLCDTWNCIGFQQAPANAKRWLDINGYAALGAGNAVSVDDSTKREYGLKIALPKIFDVLNIGLDLSTKSTVVSTLTLGKAWKRNLRKDSLLRYFRRPDVQSSAKDAFLAGKLRLIVSDIVIESLSVTIKLDAQRTASLEAKVGNLATSKTFSDASLSVKLEKVEKGTYKFTIDKPVVWAYISKRQPSAGSLGAKDTFDDWTADTINFPADPSRLKHKKK